jgi:hypothetical protein
MVAEGIIKKNWEKTKLEQNKTIGMKGNWKVFKVQGSIKMGQRWIKMASQR